MLTPPESWFDHEKLEVYRETIAFIAWLSAILENAVRVGDVKDQLDRASASIALNIAEGNGKNSPKDPLPLFRHCTRLCVRMRLRPGHSGSQGQADYGPSRSRERTTSKDRPHAHGPHQAKLHTRIRKRRRRQLIPSLTLSPALNPVPNLNLHLNLSLLLEANQWQYIRWQANPPPLLFSSTWLACSASTTNAGQTSTMRRSWSASVRAAIAAHR